MMTASERTAAIAKIRELPEQAAAAVKGLHDQQLDTPYGEGKWTSRQIIHHLADSHLNAFIRMKLIVTENYPTLKPYDQDAWAKTRDSLCPVESSLEILRGLHARWVDLLESLPDSAWARAAYHPDNGKMALEEFLKLYEEHGTHHLAQITGLRARNGW